MDFLCIISQTLITHFFPYKKSPKHKIVNRILKYSKHNTLEQIINGLFIYTILLYLNYN